MDTEKIGPNEVIDLEQLGGKQSYKLTKKSLGAAAEGLKLTADGQTVLVPQPLDHPNDPLNWSWKQKHITLATITLISGLTDFGSAVGIPTVIFQSVEWNLPVSIVQHSLSGNIFCIGAGGFVAIMFSDYFGRLPILFLFHSLGLATGVWSGAANTYNSYLAARILNGLFSGVAQSGALMWIKEIFFFHEHPRKINLWAGPTIVAPYIGPMLASFILTKLSWRWPFWLYTIMNCIAWLLVVFYLDEPIFNRKLGEAGQPDFGTRWQRLFGIPQWRARHLRPGFLAAIRRPFALLDKTPLLVVMVFGYINYAWVIGVNTTSSIWLTTIYDFGPIGLGCFYISALVGVGIGTGLGHWAHDAIGARYARLHGGKIEPEARLVLVFPASVLLAVCLIVLGFALDHEWHYMIIAVFYGAQLGSMMVAITAISAFVVDAYPEVPGETGAWLILMRTTGGFMASYIQLPWIARVGAADALGTQAAIGAVTAIAVGILYLYGKRLREWQGPVKFE